MPYLTLLIVVCCTIFYYRVGDAEYDSGLLLALISTALWVIGIFILRLGWLGNLLLQIALYVALSLWNMRRPLNR